MEWIWGAEVNQNFDPCNPEPDHRPIGVIVTCMDSRAAVIFDLPEAEKYTATRWTVESWSPLTLSPDMRNPIDGSRTSVRDGVVT